MVESQSARIASWEDVRASLAAKFTLTSQADGSLHVSVPNVKTPVTLRPHPVNGQPWIEAVAVLCPVRNLPPTPALSRNFALAIGNLAAVDGSLLLRQLLPLAGTRVADLEEVVSTLGMAIAEAAQS
jgi:hypothetical protein